MKSALVFLALCLLSACTPGPDQGTLPAEPQASSAPNPNLMQLYINSEEVDCMGVAPRKCLQTRSSEDAEWEFFYASIQDFDFEPGFVYLVEVETQPVENPAADASSIRYQLMRILSKERV